MSGGFDPRLGRVFNFTPEDLVANREGRLSPDQSIVFGNAVRIGARRDRRVRPVLLIMLVGTIVLVVGATGALDDPGTAAPAIAVVAVMLAFMALLVRLFRRRDVTNRAAMAAGVVEVVEGPWQVDMSLDGNWRIRVGGRLIASEVLAVRTLADAGVYRFYVLPLRGAAAALSVERVDAPGR